MNKGTTKKDFPDLIFIGDIHAREDQPKARNDNIWETQVRKYNWLYDFWESNKRPDILQAADLFDKKYSRPSVISLVLTKLPPMITIPGNEGKHNSSPKEFETDALNVVKVSNKGWHVLNDPKQFHLDPKGRFLVVPLMWGLDIPHPIQPKGFKGRKILLTHRNLVLGSSNFVGESAEEFLEKCHEYDIVVSGHNHTPFQVNYRNRILVNPGAALRQNAGEIHRPRVYKYWAADNYLEPVVIPYDPNAISREHIELKEAKKEQHSSYIKLLETCESIELTITFKNNMKQFLYLNSNKLRAGVIERLKRSIGEK